MSAAPRRTARAVKEMQMKRTPEWTDWRIVRLEPIAELFIVCPCRNELRLVDDRPTTCAECGRQYVMTVSLIGRERVDES